MRARPIYTSVLRKVKLQSVIFFVSIFIVRLLNKGGFKTQNQNSVYSEASGEASGVVVPANASRLTSGTSASSGVVTVG